MVSCEGNPAPAPAPAAPLYKITVTCVTVDDVVCVQTKVQELKDACVDYQ